MARLVPGTEAGERFGDMAASKKPIARSMPLSIVAFMGGRLGGLRLLRECFSETNAMALGFIARSRAAWSLERLEGKGLTAVNLAA